MKRKIAIGLCVLLSAGLLGACGSDPTTVDYNGYSYEDLKTENEQYLYYVESLYEMYAQGEDVSTYPEQYSDVTEEMIDAVYAFADTVEECGTYVGYDMDTFTVVKSGKTLTSDVTVQFSERTATFEVVYTYWSMELDGLSITTEYTLGEKMVKAALNTIISMSIVFLVLILISLIIYCFNIFPYLEKKKKEKEAAAAAAVKAEAPAVEETPAPAEETYMDDTELIAVIAAAIAASEGTSTDGFVVRSINRR